MRKGSCRGGESVGREGGIPIKLSFKQNPEVKGDRSVKQLSPSLAQVITHSHFPSLDFGSFIPSPPFPFQHPGSKATHSLRPRREIYHPQNNTILINQTLSLRLHGIPLVVVVRRESRGFPQHSEVAFHWCRLAFDFGVLDDYGVASFVVACHL